MGVFIIRGMDGFGVGKHAIFSHFWRNLLAAGTTILYENLPFNTPHTVGTRF